MWDADLNEFLTTDEVLNYQDEWCGYTFLIHRISDWALVGFYTTAADSIDLPEDWIKKKSMKPHLGVKRLPAILLGRFATDNRYKREGIGSMTLEHIITEELASPTPARIMRLTAYQETVDWYSPRLTRYVSGPEPNYRGIHNDDRLMAFGGQGLCKICAEVCKGATVPRVFRRQEQDVHA